MAVFARYDELKREIDALVAKPEELKQLVQLLRENQELKSILRNQYKENTLLPALDGQGLQVVSQELVKMIFWLCAVALFLLLLIWSTDSWFLLRVGIPYLYISKRKETIKDIFRTHVFHSCVLPADLDFMGHMNNARYLREADIARCHFFFRYGILEELSSLGGYLVMTASCSRFRHELNVFEGFDIQTRLLGWDDRTIYLEQHFVRPSDDFVVAVVLARFNVIGPTPAALMKRLAGMKVESPEMPEEVHHWMKYNQISSQKMRTEGDFQNNGKVR
ncbi:protein THEM6-like [Tiliqua scincoides]|uniref:protein THEM6-like n=1 Tax=Tiliqua scincoides TaxID=71010 RepID=UPI003462249A